MTASALDWGKVGVAEHTRDRVRSGPVHRTRSRRAPTARRNRQQYRTACGRKVEYGLPVVIESGVRLCGNCWPGA